MKNRKWEIVGIAFSAIILALKVYDFIKNSKEETVE